MIIYRYILKAHVGPFLFSLSTVIFLFLFQFLIKSIHQLVGKGLSMWVITQLVALNLAWMVTLAVPMAVLVATLMAFGSLSSNNEITIMKTSGISLTRLMIPVLIMALILSYLMVRFNNDVLPEANHQARLLLGDISRTKPTFILEAGKFSDDLGNAKILVKKTYENSNDIEGIFVYDYSSPTYRTIITAEKGDIGFTSDFNNIIMNLQNGEIHQLNSLNNAMKYRRIEFKNHRITLDAQGFGFQRSKDNAFIRGDREMSADEMNETVDSLKVSKNRLRNDLINKIVTDVNIVCRIKFKDTVYLKVITQPDTIKKTKEEHEEINDESTPNKQRSVFDSVYVVYTNIMNKRNLPKDQIVFKTQIENEIDKYDVEIYKKYSIPFACLVFALIGAPLGYKVKKGGFGIAAGFSLLFFLIYWASLIGGEKLADRGLLSPFLGMWMVNIILGIFGLYLMFKSS
ncbi:LptF/LptG family permease [Bacteroidota bacterium]